ncbi:MAG: hypothetical protein FVQ81_18375, partial [Candidatus Glassbacteria bacterium]|nr:hypothetical protein [Candidatus Glassbacteria bacterium]
MTNDATNKDLKYFTGGNTYNCPYCKRRNIFFRLIDKFVFEWEKDKPSYGYITICSEVTCKCRALHLSYYNLAVNISNRGDYLS